MNITFKVLTMSKYSLPKYLQRQSLAVVCNQCYVRQFSKTNSNVNKINDTRNDKRQITVYTGPLSSQIKMVKYFSLMTSAIGIAVQPMVYKAVAEMENLPILIATFSFVGFFTIGTPLLLHLVTKKYVLQLDYKPETNTYIAKTYNLFCIPKELEFKVDDVHTPDVPGMFTTFKAKKIPLFVDLRFFDDPSHYGKIMGYDKPVDFKLFDNKENK